MDKTPPLRLLVCTVSEVLAFFVAALAAGVLVAALTDGWMRQVAIYLFFLCTINCMVGGTVLDLKQAVVPRTDRIRNGTIDIRWGFRRLWWASWWWRSI